jgi:hypothetical protein
MDDAPMDKKRPGDRAFFRNSTLCLLFLAGNRFLRGFRHTESHDFFRRNFDRFAGGRIAADPRFTIDKNQFAETGQCKTILRLFVGECCHAVKKSFNLFLGDLSAFRQFGDDLGLGHAFPCHVYPFG